MTDWSLVLAIIEYSHVVKYLKKLAKPLVQV